MYGQPASDATTPFEWLEALPEPRRTELTALHDRVAAVAPELAASARVERQFLAYGRYAYRYASGREGEWMPLAFASGSPYISIYASPDAGVEGLGARLPKANLGKGCVRFRRLSDIDLEVVDEIIRTAARADGMRFVWTKGGGLDLTPLR